MKKGIINVLLANLLFLIVNVLINFLIPKYVSIDTYSLIKTYALYISYAGLFHLGYNDGMYLKYGGKKIEEIDKKDLGINFYNYFLLNVFMFSIIIILSIICRNYMWFAFAFGMISTNIMNYLKSLYQATGEFKLYGISLNIDRISVLILSIIAIFLLKSDNYLVFIWIQIIIGIICTLILLINLNKKLNFIKYSKFKISEYIENIKSGIILLLGNFSNSFFTTMDRWFVKILLLSYDFSLYSLAVSMENIISVAISPITITMYNYFCSFPDKKNIIKIKKLSLLYGYLIIASAYPVKFVIEKFLTKYNDAIKIIFLLFGAQLFYIIIKGIYVNLYKSMKKQKLYFIQLICMIIVGFLLNLVLFSIYKNTIAIAAATFITSIIWFITCEFINKEIAFTFKEYISIILICIVYLFTGFTNNSVLGIIIYTICSLITTIIFMKSSIMYIIDLIKGKIIKIKKNYSIKKG